MTESADERKQRLLRVRRAPEPFGPVRVVERVERSPRLLRLTLEGEVLRGWHVPQPAASMRMVVPWPGEGLELPEWNGNEFLLADGRRPALRTFTPLRVDAGRLDVEVVRHPGGAISTWAEGAAEGSDAAVSGPGAGYDFPESAERLIVLGDETALPAIGQLIETAPDGLELDVHVEVVTVDARIELPGAEDASVTWHTSAPGETPGRRLAHVVSEMDALPAATDVWAAGEASAMQAIRTHLFTTLGVERSRATVRGYWKPAKD